MPPPSTDDNGIVTIPGLYPVDETVTRLRQLLDAKGITLFAVIDHSGEAQKAGLHMPNTKLLIFGNPKAGTPLMLAAPTVALDLPLKLLIWEDAESKTWITYNQPAYLSQRHNLPAELQPVLTGAQALANAIAG